MDKKGKKSITANVNKSLADVAAKIEETDDVKLKLLQAIEKPDPEDLLYPPELNAHLIEQLKIMTCENNELRKLIFTRDQEIKESNKTVEEFQTRIRDIISGSGPTISAKSAGIISQKITDLCKQNRHLVAEIESYKTKNAALERKVMQLDIINKENEKLEVCACKDDKIDNVSPDEFKELTVKLSIVNKKLCETKNKNLELKNEILAANKVLQQELGEKFTSIKELQNNLAGWKGRARQITILQAKIAELEEKNDAKNLVVRTEPKRGDQTQLIKELQFKKKREMDQAMKNYEEIKEENAKLKKKLDAAKCRVRSLECDATTIRLKMQTFAEKSNHDDMLVNEQRNQIKTLEVYYQELLNENTMKINKLHDDLLECQKKNQNAETIIDALKKQTAEKATKIEELRTQLLRYEECSLQSVFFTPMKTARDNEVKKLSELVVTLNKRLDIQRHNWEELETSNRKLKERKKRLEKKVAMLEEEIGRSRVENTKYHSRVSKTFVHKDSTTEATKKSVGSGDVKSSEDSESPSSEPLESLDKEDLKYKLELTEEKLKSLEDKLQMLEEEKSEDFTHLTEMIQTSKQLFNEALAVLKKEKCVCTTDNYC